MTTSMTKVQALALLHSKDLLIQTLRTELKELKDRSLRQFFYSDFRRMTKEHDHRSIDENLSYHLRENEELRERISDQAEQIEVIPFSGFVMLDRSSYPKSQDFEEMNKRVKINFYIERLLKRMLY